MQKRRLTLLTALLLSVLLHFVVVAGGEVAWPDFYSTPDEVLDSKKPEHIQRVQIMGRPPVAKKAAATGTRFVSKAAAKAKPAKAPAPAPQEKTPDPLTETAEATSETAAAETAAETPPAPPPPVELAPAFPVQMAAELELHVDSLSAVLRQTWVMEGFRYFIDMNGKKFGFRLQVTSEGSVNPEGGLRPDHSRLLLNGKVQNFTDYADGMVRYGKTGSPREQALAAPPQDMASLPFHVAVTFNGQPMTLLVTTGKRIYEVRMTVLAEETLKLPVGTLRTLHLQGERYDPESHSLIRDYDIWLAPDYLNFPVKFIGQSGSGNRYEYRLKALEIEGKLVLGQKGDAEPVSAEEAIPEWIRQRTQTEGLNNP